LILWVPSPLLRLIFRLQSAPLAVIPVEKPADASSPSCYVSLPYVQVETMTYKQLLQLAVLVALALVFPAAAQLGKWAAADDPTAKSLIDLERQWAESACTHSLIQQTILADDFQGTAPDGSRYSKSEAIEGERNSKIQERECHLHDAKVRFFGDNIAVTYGDESAILKTPDGKEQCRALIWTDTWLKRNGTWQCVAAQDTSAGCK